MTEALLWTPPASPQDFRSLSAFRIAVLLRLLSPLPTDMSKRKKVHFADSLGTKEKDSNLDAPSNKLRRPKSLNFHDRKTSEYKYFREIQDKICHDPQFSQITKKDYHRRMLKQTENKKEICKSIRLNSGISLSSPISITPLSEKSLITSKAAQDELGCPIHSEYNKNGVLPALSIIPIAQRCPIQTSQDSWNSAFKYESEGLFSDKRSKLLALLSKTYSMETNKLILNRSDIISKVVKRLRIVKESNRELEDFLELEKVSDDRYQLTNLPLDVPFNWCNNLESPKIAAHPTRTELCKYSFLNDFNEGEEHERFELSCSEVQAFPDALEDDLLVRSHCNWKLDGTDSPEQCASWISTSLAKWKPDNIKDVTNKVQLESSEELVLHYYSSCHSTDGSLVPYTKAKCLDLSCLNKLEECSVFSLPVSLWNANSVEQSFCSAANHLVPFGIDHILPTSHAASNARGQISEHGWRNIFHSQLSKNCEMMLQDSTHQTLDTSCPKLRHNLELPYKCLPVNLDWGRLSAAFVDRQPSKDELENSEALSACASKCDGRIDDAIQAAYCSSPSFGSWVLEFDG